MMMKSLVKMEGEDSSLLVRNSEWNNIVFCGSGSVLSNGEGSFEGIKYSAFSNITMKFMEEDKAPFEKVMLMKMSIMEDSQVERTMNVLEGVIVSGTEGSIAFSCYNCTFVHNKREDWRVGNTERNSTTQTQNFSNAKWDECSAPCGGALYVHDNPNATLTVENSSFVKCNATSTRGGGIYALNISECTVKQSTFVECYCVASDDAGGAGIQMNLVIIQVFVDNCLFKDGWSGNDAGGVGIWQSKSTKTNDSVLSCLFQNCSGHNNINGDGGGILHWHAKDKIVFKNSLFHGCHSDWRGGALSINMNGFGGELIWFCFFHSNTSPNGNDIYIADNSTDSQLVFCYSTRIEGVRYFANGDKSEWLPNNFSKHRFVASTQNQTNAKNTFSCGLNESCTCLTISHCLSQMISGFVEEIKVLSGTVVEGKGIEIGEKTISVNGVSPSGSSIETQFEGNGQSLFCVGTGELNVSDLSVIHNSSIENNRRSRLFEVQGTGGINLERLNISMDADHSEERSIQNSLMKLKGGNLKMKDVRWEQTFSTASLISLSQGSLVTLSLDNCTFSNIVKTTGGSSLMNVDEGSYSITLEGCTIDGCGSEASEFGGGMLVEVESGSSLNVKGGVVKNCFASTIQGRGGGTGLKVKDIGTDFHISSAFEGNRAKWGSDIFVDSIDLNSTAKSRKITSLTASFDTKGKIQGYDNGNDTFPIPMCVYLIPLPEEIIVSNVDTFDYFYCGFSEVPCLTLRHSLTRQEKEKKIVVDGMIEIQYELSFDSFKHTIRGKDGSSGWKVSNDPNGVRESMITVSVNANMSSLVFSVPSVLPNHEAFFGSSSQLFSFDDCSLTFQDPQSALSYIFLYVSAGEVSVSSFNVLSLTIENCPLICLDGSNAAGTFTSMIVEDIFSETNSVLFGEANGASFSIKDSTLSVKASSQADLPSGSIRVISSNSAKMLKLTNNTMSGFKGDGGDGGAMECTLEKDCSLEIIGGLISECESKGGNGGGLWVEMNEGSIFTVGNMTDANQLRTKTSNDESGLLQLVSCKATHNTDGECGYGGGIYLHLDDGASSFTLKDVSFSGCDAREGKGIFINANDFSSVISRSSIGFVVDLDDVSNLNGFERSTLNEIFAIPLVVYLWNNFSGPALVGGRSSHDFSLCGYESFPCSTISKAASVHFEGKKKDITILEAFAFQEELSLSTDEWSIKGKENEMKCEVSDQKDGAQSGLIENSASASVTGIVFSLKKSQTFHESVFECHSGKLILNECEMEGGTESISTVFVKAVEGAVEINEFATKGVTKRSSSFFIVEGSINSRPSMNMMNCDFGEISFDDGCVVECHNGNIEEMSGCTFSSITRSKGSGGCISVSNKDAGREYKVEINNCTFEDCAVVGEEEETGGGTFFFEASANTNLLISRCKFYCCTTPFEGESVGFGGGIMLNLLNEEEALFAISSPTFSSDKPNNAKYGKDLFVSSPSLINSIKNETLPFVKDRLEMLTEDSMRGYDGRNRECAIPLIYFWKNVGSSVYVALEGNNVVVCGPLEYPCASVDYGLKRGSNLGIGSITVQGLCDVRSEINMSGMMLEGTNRESDKIIFVQAIEGNANSVAECKGVVQFKEAGMVIPTAFDNGARTLIQAGSDAIKTSIVYCSIHISDNAEGELSFVLISAVKGIVEIEKTKMAGLASMHEIMSISVGCVIATNDVTLENISLSGKSAIAMSETVVSGSENDNSEVWNFLFGKCTFVNVKNSVTSNPSLLCCDVQNEMRLKMQNSTIDGCGSGSSNEGGGIFFLLNERGRLEMNHTNVTDCFCSNIGRGGGLFLKSQSITQEMLPFVLSNITFKGNVASKGRDVFVKCTDLDSQITEWQFLLNFGAPFVKELAIWGCTSDNYGDEEDLLGRVFVFRSEFIFVSTIAGNSSDSKNCGEMKGACLSLNVGVSHIIPSDYSQLYIWNETALTGSCSAQKVTIKSMEANRNAEIKVREIELESEGVVNTSESVRFEKLSFVFSGMQNAVCSCFMHQLNGSLILESVTFLSESGSMENSRTLFDFSLLIVENGLFEADRCSVSHLGFSKPVFQMSNSESATFEDLTIRDVRSTSPVIECGTSRNLSILKLEAINITLQDGSLISFKGNLPTLFVLLSQSSFTNISQSQPSPCIICAAQSMTGFEMCNCSFRECISDCVKGSQVVMVSTENVLMDLCQFEGSLIDDAEEMNGIADAICKWNGSIIDLTKSSVLMKDTTICNFSKGGITVRGGYMTIEAGNFSSNNPSIDNYPSMRRNIVCSDSASLSISSMKGGDGVKDNSSLWILNEGCSFEGIAFERASSFFIPVLESIETKKKGTELEIVFKGKLLLPCNLSFMVVMQIGDEKQIEKYGFDESGYLRETEVEGRLKMESISEAEDEAEVKVCILFGDAKGPSSTDSFILKNQSEPKVNGDERIAEGGKEVKISWAVIIAVIFAVLFLIVLIIAVAFIVRWKKSKRRTEELQEIVNDNIRKDPKAFEMITMEMSPEEQWRRAEREAEKKNDERIKKRVYEKSLGHSESSEHLLSECGSTEYILGKDSDKIPDWALEKLEEDDDNEEAQKGSPSPSISSTSTTDTSDTESTFVRSESLFPTTSSMSNLVDAMACSSPHEKLIVDLRDSLFMLLHGRNKTKEMAIGSLKEREQTAAQILFWVANGALHSFDEMENPLQSLSNLSPHIVLFSEHMVICIAMHSDCSSDSDTSSISSASTIVTSSSDCSRANRNGRGSPPPSSAFEDEDDFKKECLRWKAPELLINKKLGATKESVVFSIGMMLWECLTLHIPFGEYEAVIAGDKITKGERPDMANVSGSTLSRLVSVCFFQQNEQRPKLADMKRELIQRFPPGSVILTASDAIDDGAESGYYASKDGGGDYSGSAAASNE